VAIQISPYELRTRFPPKATGLFRGGRPFFWLRSFLLKDREMTDFDGILASARVYTPFTPD